MPEKRQNPPRQQSWIGGLRLLGLAKKTKDVSIKIHTNQERTMSRYSSQVLTFEYVSNKGWVGGGRSSFVIHFLIKNQEVPNQEVLNFIWKNTQGSFGYLAVKESEQSRVVVTLAPGNSEKVRERFAQNLERYLVEQKK